MWVSGSETLELETWLDDLDQENRLVAIAGLLTHVPGGFCMPWPGAGGPAGLRRFDSVEAWRVALQDLDLDPACAAPMAVRNHKGIGDGDFSTALVAGGTVVGRLRKIRDDDPGVDRPTLSEMRNRLAHGDPFEGLPLGGLLHVVRDLIHFIYR